MSPSIETELCGGRLEYIVIQLDTPEEFNPKLFDESARQLGMGLKWIVRGDKMIIFRGDLKHSDIYEKLSPEEYPGELKAAGLLDMTYSSEGNQREILGYSRGLAPILPPGNSDQFKKDVIKPQLEAFFKFK